MRRSINAPCQATHDGKAKGRQPFTEFLRDEHPGRRCSSGPDDGDDLIVSSGKRPSHVQQRRRIRDQRQSAGIRRVQHRDNRARPLLNQANVVGHFFQHASIRSFPYGFHHGRPNPRILQIA